jgi:hypothetical protein
VSGVGEQLYVVAGHGAALAVSYHVRVRVGTGGACHELLAIVLLLLLQALDFAHCRFQAARRLPRHAPSRRSLPLRRLLRLLRLCVQHTHLLLPQFQVRFQFCLRRRLLAPAFALIFVPSSVTRSSVIRPSALIIPST